MPQNDPALDALRRDPQAAKLLGNPAGLRALLAAPETQTLMALLRKNAGSSLQTAAQAAAQGKPQDLAALLSQVLKDPAGAAAAEGIQKKAKS